MGRDVTGLDACYCYFFLLSRRREDSISDSRFPYMFYSNSNLYITNLDFEAPPLLLEPSFREIEVVLLDRWRFFLSALTWPFFRCFHIYFLSVQIYVVHIATHMKTYTGSAGTRYPHFRAYLVRVTLWVMSWTTCVQFESDCDRAGCRMVYSL